VDPPTKPGWFTAGFGQCRIRQQCYQGVGM
jgi:hypothetical protein